jgi:hypothetical protein
MYIGSVRPFVFSIGSRHVLRIERDGTASSQFQDPSLEFVHQRPRHLVPNSIAGEDGNGDYNSPYDNDSGCFTFSLVHESLTAVITAPSKRSPFLHPHSHHPVASPSAFTAMSRLTQSTYSCPWLPCSTASRTANFEEKRGGGWSPKAGQPAYNQWDCIQYDTIFFSTMRFTAGK